MTACGEPAANNFWTEIMFYANGWTVDETLTAFRLFNRFEGKSASKGELEAAPEFPGGDLAPRPAADAAAGELLRRAWPSGPARVRPNNQRSSPLHYPFTPHEP